MKRNEVDLVELEEIHVFGRREPNSMDSRIVVQ